MSSKFALKNINAMKHTPLSAAVLFSVISMFGTSAIAADEKDKIKAKDKSDETIEEVVSIGSRSSRARTASDSTVPIDSISAEQFGAIGNAGDITDNLKAFVPSFTATPATGDGSAFVRPTSLRGLAPDQTLVLINGKRRHRSALVHFFAPAAGNGAHGADIGMIPSIALGRVDVLRDGASSQYGSDAIAGVINFVLKDADEGGSFMAQYGQYYEGESSFKAAVNKGLKLGDSGFLNFSAEYVDNDGLSRGVQRPDAQALIDAGVTGVGEDTPFDDAPLVQSWGRPENGGIRMFVNGGTELDNGSTAYFHANVAETTGTYRFFYRPGDNPATGGTNEAHSTLQALQTNDGYTGSVLNTGYTPYLIGDQEDFSIATGLKGKMNNGWAYDYSIAYGSNLLDYTLKNTINADLGLDGSGNIAQRNFDVGGYKQSEVNVNADFSKLLTDTLNLAYGFEWREESYESIQGEPNSYFELGSSGFFGISPANAGTFKRDNVATYVEAEKDVSEDLLVQAALRYEDFSDFGTTVNGKLASRYNVSEATALRGGISTGFHAPTPGQANVTTTITTFDGNTGLQVEERLLSPTSAEAIANGGKALTEETSVNLSIGFTTELNNDSTLTVDFYNIDIDDRIYRVGNIDVAGGDSISFYTNALDVRSKGIDLVYTTSIDWSSIPETDLTLALNYSKLEVTGQSLVNGIQPVSDATVEDIENNYPELRFVLSTNTQLNERWSLMARANYYGSHYDERGTIGAATDPSAKIDPVVYFDVEASYQMKPNLKLVFGASNIFDTYVDEIEAPFANRQSVGLQYPRRSAANYEGGSWYMSANYRF